LGLFVLGLALFYLAAQIVLVWVVGILKLVLGVAALLGGIYLVSKVYYEIRGRSSTPQS